MGGKTGMTGILDFYANGHLEALSSANKGRLLAHGMAPEGIENNEVIYELLSDAGWSDKETDIHGWLKEYSCNRYGRALRLFADAGIYCWSRSMAHLPTIPVITGSSVLALYATAQSTSALHSSRQSSHSLTQAAR